jgi:hypothetical protein
MVPTTSSASYGCDSQFVVKLECISQAGGVAQVVEHLPIKHEAQSSNPSIHTHTHTNAFPYRTVLNKVDSLPTCKSE